MKIVVISGDRQVHVDVKGSNRKTLRKAQKTASRLLAETAAPAASKVVMGFQPVEEE